MKTIKLKSKKNIFFLSGIVLSMLSTMWLKYYNDIEDSNNKPDTKSNIVENETNKKTIANENICPVWEVKNKDEYLFVDCNGFY